MAIRKRNKVVIDSNNEDDLEIIEEEKKPSYERSITLKEKTIEIINALEASGVNIYEEGRYGGMYLKQPNSNPSQNLPKELKQKFKENINSVNNHEKLLEENSSNLNNLFNHFKNNK